MQKPADGHESAVKSPPAPLGAIVRWIDQFDPFHRSASGTF
jgi:hypothetical protein